MKIHSLKKYLQHVRTYITLFKVLKIVICFLLNKSITKCLQTFLNNFLAYAYKSPFMSRFYSVMLDVPNNPNLMTLTFGDPS